jgi:DNA-binding transcriptional ArsR family regulator
MSVTAIFRAPGDPTRRDILASLRADGDLTAGQLADHFSLARTIVAVAGQTRVHAVTIVAVARATVPATCPLGASTR